MFAASIGLTKTSVAAIVKDDGIEIFLLHSDLCIDRHRYVEVTLDLGGYDIEAELFEPLQTLLNQCKGAKSMSKYVASQWLRKLGLIRFRKLTKRLEELIQDSMAVKSHLIPQMKTLCNSIAELVNFGISVCGPLLSQLFNN